MADEELVLRASVQDEATAPLERIDRAVDDVGRSTAAAGRRAGTEGAQGLNRFEAAGRRMHTQLRRWDSDLRRFSRTVGSTFATGVRRGATALGAMTAAAGVFGVKSASNFQATGVAFETMLGSAERGQALFRELQALNLKTPFELNDLADAEQMLLRFNVGAEQSVGVLKGLSDVAALSGAEGPQNLQAMARAIGQIASTGRLTGQDALQLVQGGIDAYGIYAQKLGITTAEARKLGEEGKLSADILLEAVTNLDGGLERFRGGAEKMSQTLMGQWSNLKDTINIGLAEAASPLVAMLGEQIGTPDRPGPLVAGITTLISTAGPPLFTFLATVIGGLSRLMPVVEPILTSLVTGLDRLFTAASPALSALEPLGGDIGDALVELVDALVPVMPDLVYGFVGLVGVLPDFVRLLAAMVPLVSPIARLVGDLLDFAPVRGIMAGLLTVLLGYRALSGVVGAMYAFATALGAINAAEAAGGGGRRSASNASKAWSWIKRAAPAAGRKAGKAGAAAAALTAAVYGANELQERTNIGFGADDDNLRNPEIDPRTGAPYVDRRPMGDLPPRYGSTMARDAGVEAATPGSRSLTSSHRTHSVLSSASGHVQGTAVDRHGSFMARYRENVKRAGGWAAQHGNHMHADYGDLVTPARARPTGMPAASSAGARTLVVQGNVIGIDDLHAQWKQWNRDLDDEDRRRHRKPQP